MVDIDIQGAEYGHGSAGLLNSQAIALLTKRVKRVHIGLHGSKADDEALLRGFATQGWRLVWYFPRGGSPFNTSFGPVWFADGVASFSNEQLLEAQPDGC